MSKISRRKFLGTGAMAAAGLSMVSSAALAQGTQASNAALFSRYVYQGDDPIYRQNPLEPDEFYTPAFQGAYPDPSITRKGNDFYMTFSTFVMTPGMPIFHSNDCVNWRQIGHIMDRPEQLGNISTMGIAHGIFAPAIRYNPFNDTFYALSTIVYGLGNFVVKCKNPLEGNWSNPIRLNFGGIDPSIFFDDDGKAYVAHNCEPAREDVLYSGHRVIRIWEYDLENDQVIPGSDRIAVNGGVNIAERPVWIEMPHIWKKRDGRYVMICAEGGTSWAHRQVVFEADHPMGEWKPAVNNPILTQRFLDPNRRNRVDWAGHADMVVGPDDEWLAVFHGCRPNNVGRVNTGRETHFLPADWSGEWPVFKNGLIPLRPKIKMPRGVVNRTLEPGSGFFPNGNFTYEENFLSSAPLDYRWVAIRCWFNEFGQLTPQGLRINPMATHILERRPTSTLYMRQQHNHFNAAFTLTYRPTSPTDMAGMVCMQSEAFNYVMGVTLKDGHEHILLARSQRRGSGQAATVETTIIASERVDLSQPIRLRVDGQGDDVRFSFAPGGGDNFRSLGGTVSGDILSTCVAGGFTGAMIGLYATSANTLVPA